MPCSTDTGCVSTPTAQGGPLKTAPKTEWYVADTGQPMPKTAAGPRVMRDGLGFCYTPDTLGALTAVANISARVLSDCWVFAPQQLIGEPSSWWWNSLTLVTSAERSYSRPIPPTCGGGSAWRRAANTPAGSAPPRT